MRKVILEAGVTLLTIGIIVALLPYFIGMVYEFKERIEVPPLSREGYVLRLKAGDIVEGYFTVRGGANDDIAFYVQDPKGSTIYKPADRVFKHASFKLTATMDGEYFLYYDNSFSLLSSKTVFLTMKVIPLGTFAWMMYLGVALAIVGAIVIIVGIKPKQ